MKITNIAAQVKNPDRVNISIDGAYRFSLDINQLVGLGVKVGNDYSEQEIIELENESRFGKLYSRALEYSLLRPHSIREVRDYLWKKTRDKRDREGRVVKGYSADVAQRVLERLQQKKYVNDEQFARWWVETRRLATGASARKITAELMSKGVESTIITEAIQRSGRDDEQELKKMIIKKRVRYNDNNKLMAYLARQGFAYDDIKRALSEDI
ncbi:hypothetical protein EOL96_01800 [Candidatus Saccharibacteria bacterium]|nr:hypothetical protein [Candidatus Saccharibacteria bacterium]